MKIVQVVNKIIENKDKISEVQKNGKEYFFKYDSRYIWSILRGEEEEEYWIHFYPKVKMSYEELLDFREWHTLEGDYLTYSTSVLKTQEAFETFKELYHIIADKLLGVNDIFDEILRN